MGGAITLRTGPFRRCAAATSDNAGLELAAGRSAGRVGPHPSPPAHHAAGLAPPAHA